MQAVESWGACCLDGQDGISYAERIRFTGTRHALRTKRYPLIYRGCGMGSRIHRSQCDNTDRELGHPHPIPVSTEDIAQDTGQIRQSRGARRIADLDPYRARAGPVGAVYPLRHDALGAEPAGVREHGRTILGDVFIEQDAGLGPAQQARQRGLAVEKREIPEILAIVLDQVEGIEDCGPGLSDPPYDRGGCRGGWKSEAQTEKPPIVRPAAFVGGLLRRTGLIRRGESEPIVRWAWVASRRLISRMRGFSPVPPLRTKPQTASEATMANNEVDLVLTPTAHLAKIADELNPPWRTNGLPLSSTWMLEMIKLLKDECEEVGQQLDAAEADVARLRSGEATPDMIAAGINVLNASGAIEHPLDANQLLVADIYRAMVRARPANAPMHER